MRARKVAVKWQCSPREGRNASLEVREVKKKPKTGEQKTALQPFSEVPQNVEVVKPKRKPRTEKGNEDEG